MKKGYSKDNIKIRLERKIPLIPKGKTTLGERESVNNPANIPPRVIPRLLAEIYLDKSNLEILFEYRSRKIGRVSCHNLAAIKPTTIVINFPNFGSTHNCNNFIHLSQGFFKKN